MPKDYYKTLGVEKGATKDEIKKAFRKKAHEHHPDKGGDEAKFKEVNEAYQVLSDEQKRQQYDQFGQTFDGAGPGGFGGFGGQGFGGINMDDLGDIFGDMFGGGFGGGSRGRRAKGQDVLVDIDLTFKEAVFGAEKEITVAKNCECERCGSVGAEPGSAMKTCSTCDGQGFTVTVQRTMLGNMQARTTCADCQGRGEVPEEECSVCNGTGSEYKRKTLKVDIPVGVENGMRMRIRGEGESIGVRGEAGDLYIRLHVKDDKRFERDGDVIYSDAEIGFTQAALGDEIDVETVDGKVKLKVPAGTQSGDKLRLKGKGVPRSLGRGDHIVVVSVKTPKKLSRKQKQLLEELDLKS